MSRQDRVYKDYTSNPIPTSFFSMIVLCIYLGSGMRGLHLKKKDVGMGLLV